MSRQVWRGSRLITKDLEVVGDVTIGGNVAVTGTLTPALGEDFADTNTIHDPDTTTKKARFDCVGISADQTRVFTLPDYNATVATIAGTETLTGKTLTSPKIGTKIDDANGKELFLLTATASAVNEVTYANAAAGGSPSFTASGDDAAVSIKLAGKGAGKIIHLSRSIDFTAAPAQVTTASNVTFTAAQLLSGFVDRDPNGGARADILPLATDLIAAIPGAAVGSWFEFTLRNSADASEAITVTTNNGWTLSGTMTIAQNNSKRFRAEMTAAATCTLYSLGTFVH